MTIPVDDDIQSIVNWCQAMESKKFWTPYLALISGLYQESNGLRIDYGTYTLESAIELINDPERRNKQVWLK